MLYKRKFNKKNCLLRGTPAEVLDAAASTTVATQALYEESGRVVTNNKAPEFLGAAKGTNNAGELSAVYHALTRANEVLPHYVVGLYNLQTMGYVAASKRTRGALSKMTFDGA